jgi:glycosyltransferase involved in cell wall biosynthesis
MRTVVHFVDTDTFGGSEQSLLHLLEGLDRARWRPVLLHHPAAGLAQLLEGAAAAGVTVRQVPRVSDADVAWRLPGLVRALGVDRPAVFHAHLNWPLACKFGLVAARIRRVPVVIGTVQLFVAVLVNRSVRFQQRIVSAGVHRYVAVSEEVARRMATCFGISPAKLRVIHNGIDPGPFGRPPDARLRTALIGDPHRPLVLTLARLAPQKGLDTLVAAARLVPEAVFVVAGDGPERGALEAQAATLGLADRMRFLGHRRDVAALLDACDVFALPSLFEGLPLAVLEAMAAGKPVVASHIGGTDEAVLEGVTGLLVPPADPCALARAIRVVLADPALARRLGAAGRSRVDAEFSARRMVRAVEATYDEVLAATEGR